MSKSEGVSTDDSGDHSCCELAYLGDKINYFDEILCVEKPCKTLIL